MILRAAIVLATFLAAPPVLAADTPARVPPDRAAMSQFIATPIEPSKVRGAREESAAGARKSNRVRYTIPAPKRM